MATFNRRGYKKSKSDQAQKGEKSQTAEVFESLDSTANKSEQWILKNQNIILTFIGVISLSVLSYLGYERFISDPNEKEAISELNKAQYFFELALVSNESDSLFKLGLLGTIIGFVLMLQPISNVNSFDEISIKNALTAMSAGMSIALFTTLSGLIGSLLLKVQYYFFENSTEKLFHQVSELSEIHIKESNIK